MKHMKLILVVFCVYGVAVFLLDRFLIYSVPYALNPIKRIVYPPASDLDLFKLGETMDSMILKHDKPNVIERDSLLGVPAPTIEMRYAYSTNQDGSIKRSDEKNATGMFDIALKPDSEGIMRSFSICNYSWDNKSQTPLAGVRYGTGFNFGSSDISVKSYLGIPSEERVNNDLTAHFIIYRDLNRSFVFKNGNLFGICIQNSYGHINKFREIEK